MVAIPQKPSKTGTRVLFYLPQLGLGGTEKTCLLFGKYLSRDFEPFLCFPAECHHKERLCQFEESFGYERVIPIESTIQDIIDEYEIDIVHSFRSGYEEYPEPGKDFQGPRFVETNVFGHWDWNREVDRSLFMSEWLLDQTRRRIAVTRAYVPQERWGFVNNPVIDRLSYNSMRCELGIGDDAVVLGRCGRPDPGIYDDVNVKAALLLLSEGHDIHFLAMAPPQNMRDDLERYGIPHTCIDPTVDPYVLSEFYNTVDIYTHARADGETFGVNIAEAMIHNLPVVTHVAVPSFPGMGVFQSQTTLVRDGVTGYVVERDPGAYANAVRNLIVDPDLRATMGWEGRAIAENEYLASVCTEKLEGYYKGLMNE